MSYKIDNLIKSYQINFLIRLKTRFNSFSFLPCRHSKVTFSDQITPPQQLFQVFLTGAERFRSKVINNGFASLTVVIKHYIKK